MYNNNKKIIAHSSEESVPMCPWPFPLKQHPSTVSIQKLWPRHSERSSNMLCTVSFFDLPPYSLNASHHLKPIRKKVVLVLMHCRNFNACHFSVACDDTVFMIFLYLYVFAWLTYGLNINYSHQRCDQKVGKLCIHIIPGGPKVMQYWWRRNLLGEGREEVTWGDCKAVIRVVKSNLVLRKRGDG